MTSKPEISEAWLGEVVARIEREGVTDTTVSGLRQSNPGVHFTLCMDDDITTNAKPVAGRDGFKLYLVNSSGHCSILTNEFSAASGVVVAEVLPD